MGAFDGCYFKKGNFINNSNADGYPWDATLYNYITEDCLIIKNDSIIKAKDKEKTTYTIPDSITSIGDYAFYNCSSLTSITIPDSVTSIGEFAFSECISLTSINIPDSVISIGYCAFSDCTSLTSIIIPNSVTSIGEETFWGCYFQKGNFINNSNADGYPWNAIIYDYITEDSLYIANNSIINVKDKEKTTYTITDSITSIGEFAFSDCSALTSITIPNSVTNIGNGAFAGCSCLTDIYYKGSEDQWNSITKGSNWNYGTPSNLTIHYNS